MPWKDHICIKSLVIVVTIYKILFTFQGGWNVLNCKRAIRIVRRGGGQSKLRLRACQGRNKLERETEGKEGQFYSDLPGNSGSLSSKNETIYAFPLLPSEGTMESYGFPLQPNGKYQHSSYSCIRKNDGFPKIDYWLKIWFSRFSWWFYRCSWSECCQKWWTTQKQRRSVNPLVKKKSTCVLLGQIKNF